MEHIKTFTTLITENQNFEKTILDKLSKYIQRRFKSEDSIIYTYWIAKILEYKTIIFVSNVEMSEELKDVKKAYILINNNKYFDGEGLHTLEEICKEQKFKFGTHKDYLFRGEFYDFTKLIELKKLKLTAKIEKELKEILNIYKSMLIK